LASAVKARFVIQNVENVSALLMRPPEASCLLVLAHGAGAGMNHPFMESIAGELAAAGVATFRYQFPYMERQRRVPDPPRVLMAAVRAAVSKAREMAPELPLLAGGKSLGGRMTSQAAAAQPLDGVRGLVFFGFPLHPPGRPGTTRAGHLARVNVPMLFLQGTRDQFADLNLLRPIIEELRSKAALHVVDTADHSFHVLKRSGRADSEVLQELAHVLASWARTAF
jgi:predicted alpha/beta-hydrolase family hydrolase